MVYKENKKGLAFWALLPVFTLFLLVLVILSYQSPMSGAVDELNFGETLRDTDEYVLEKSILNNYFFNTLPSLEDEIVDKYLGEKSVCFSDTMNMPVWFDMQRDEDDCIPKPYMNEEEYRNFIEDEFVSNLESDASSLGVDNFEMGVEESGWYLEVFMRGEVNRETGPAEIDYVIEESEEFPINYYTKIVEAANYSLSDFDDTLSTQVPECMSENRDEHSGRDLRSHCIEDAFKSQFFEKIDEDEIDLNMTYLDIDSDEYFGHKVEVIETQENEEIMEFGITLEVDSIPFELLTFDLDDYEYANNMGEMKVYRPETAGRDVGRYVILLSNENFFNEDIYGSDRYNTLLELLEDGEIPDAFSQSGFDISNTYYRHAEEEYENLDLTVLVTEAGDYSESDGELFKELSVFQLYDYEQEEYKRLQEGEEVYAFAFAIGHDPTYYIEDIVEGERGATSFVPEIQIGPEPFIKGEDLFVENDLDGLSNSFEFSIDGYEEDIEGIEVYVWEETQFSYPGRHCDDLEDDSCSYEAISLNDPNGDYLVTSSPEDIDNLGAYDEVIDVSSFDLEPSEEYKFLVAGVDQYNNAIIESQSKLLFKENNHYYSFEENLLLTTDVSDVEIIDNQPPHPLDSIELIGNDLHVEGGDILLDWRQAQEGANIENLYLTLEAYNEDGDFLGRDSQVYVDDSGNVDFDYDSSYHRIVVDNILPQDTSGNIYDGDEVETYSAEWVE